jgi:hypothetical protein
VPKTNAASSQNPIDNTPNLSLKNSDTHNEIEIPAFLTETKPIVVPETLPTVTVTEPRESTPPVIDEPDSIIVGRIPYDYTQTVPESEPVDDEYFKDALFIGDSRMVGLLNYGGVESYYYAKVALTIRGVYNVPFIDDYDSAGNKVTRTILDTVAVYPQFKKLYISFGLNELGWDENAFKNSYAYVIESFQKLIPDLIIYIKGIVPVSKKVSDVGRNNVTNEAVNRFNGILADLANEKKVLFLGINEILLNEDKTLNEDMSWDGIHLNIDSCKKEMEYIRCHVVDFETKYLRPDEKPTVVYSSPNIDRGGTGDK